MYVLHGILGSGRNILSFAKSLQRSAPDHRFVIVDLRNHGGSQGAPEGDDLQTVARDLITLGEELGFPKMLIAHSYGGKVAFRYAQLRATDELDLWILDTCPSHAETDFIRPGDNVVLNVLQILRKVSPPASTREETIKRLEVEGLSKPIAMWLATNLVSGKEGLAWVFNLNRIKAMVEDYYAFDAWPMLEHAEPHHFVHFVRGESSNRFRADEIERLETLNQIGAINLHTIEDAGHWVHVDNPDDLLACVLPTLLS